MATKTNSLFKCKSWYAKLLLTFFMTVFSSHTIYAYDFEVNEIYYNINEDETSVSVAGCSDGYSGDIVIPSSVTYNDKTYSVTSIRNHAFRNCSSLTSIELLNSVTSIGVYAFGYCSSLISIKIPNSVMSIAYNAFSGCESLTSIKVASDNPVYDSRENCNAIIETSSGTLIAGCKNTVIPNSVTSIGDRAFFDCFSLTSIEIPNSVTSIGNSAFFGCFSLTSIEISNSVTNIGDYAFSGCSSLTFIEIPNSVTGIGYDAFEGCSSLTSIEIPNSVTSIRRYTFSGCSSLTSIVIPNSVTSIGSNAFSGCTSLKTFYCNNTQLTTLDVSELNALTVLLCYNNQFGTLDISNNTELKHLDCSDNKLTALDISNNQELVWLYCNGNQLTTLDVSKNTALKYLHCNDSQLATLNVSKNAELNEIYCYNNQLQGSSMDAFINSLPVNTTDEVHILRIQTDEEGEGNICTKTQVAAIKAKGWIPYRKSNGEWTEYEGSIVVEINDTNFPDENFRNYLLEQDYGKDGIITETEIASITRIIVSDRNISSLQGIEFFTVLSFLRCFGNQLTSLDVSKNLTLTDLDCRSNMIASLDVSKNTALQVLWCGDNPITTLDVSCNTALTELHCSYTQITTLDVSNNINLTKLWCSHNQLTTLNMSENVNLTLLDCGANQLVTLDVSKNINLTLLDCWGNQLATLDVSKNTKLTSLDCISNQLTTLDVSKNTKLTEISCYKNQLQGKSMDAFINSLPTNTTDTLYKLQLMHSYNENNICTKKQVAAIKAKGWTPFYSGGMVEYEGSEEIIDINETNFPDENFRGYLLTQSYGIDGKITETEIENITSINVSNKNISSLQGIEHFTALMQLLCGNNKLTTLDVSQNTELTHLGCDSNQLTALNVSENTKLIWLYCHSNKLTALDVSNNTELRYLHCYDNQLTTLDVSRNTELKSLECYNNNISGYAMDTFISSLPMNIGGEPQPLRLLTDDMDEGNYCTMEQAQAFKVKGWTPMVRIEGVWVEYDEATAITLLNAETEDDDNAEYYTLDGVRVEKPTKKGIYIKNGKKVVIK